MTVAALPKTYHQLEVLEGTSCSAASMTGVPKAEPLFKPVVDVDAALL